MRRLDAAAVQRFSRSRASSLAAMASIAACFALGACSGRVEGVDEGARAAAASDGGLDAAGECSAIQACPSASSGDGGDGGKNAADATAPTPPKPPAPASDASPPTNPAGCPAAPPIAGDICHVEGVACAWLTSCSQTQCTCDALGNGPASWQCAGADSCADAGH